MIRLLCSIVMIVLTFSASADISGRVVRVLDGDTVEILETGNRLTRVRLAGIDAPEKSQPFGQRSRQALSSMVAHRNRHRRRYGSLWTAVGYGVA